jgi:hypothetical protein
MPTTPMSSSPIMPILKPVDWLQPYPGNAKKHPPEQVKRLAATIRAHGWDQPIVTEVDGTIIKGHGRRLAAIELGLTEVPVIVRADLTREQAAAARIADNAAVSLQYDTEVMKAELTRLMADMPELNIDDLALTGKELEFLTTELATPALDAIMTDTTAAVEQAKREDEVAVAEADTEEVPLGKAFGFNKVKVADQRVLTSFMAEAEAATGKTGYDAFIAGLRLAAARGLA